MNLLLAFVWLILSGVWTVDYAITGDPFYVVIAFVYQAAAIILFVTNDDRPKAA